MADDFEKKIEERFAAIGVLVGTYEDRKKLEIMFRKGVLFGVEEMQKEIKQLRWLVEELKKEMRELL